MKVKKIVKSFFYITACLGMIVPAFPTSAATYEFKTGSDGKMYWYEDGLRQGTIDDKQGIIGDGTNRGREIYDPVTNGWYWLDSVYNGAKAEGKEVWVPYIYQDELISNPNGIGRIANGITDESKITELASLSITEEADMSAQVADAIRNRSGKWVRYDENGCMLKGWVTIEGELADCYPDQEGNVYYYDQMTGLMAKGYVTINGETYHFDETTGVLDEGTHTNAPKIDPTTRPNANERTGTIKELEVGDVAPDFTVTLTSGETFTLSDHDSELTLINFWATWCGPCKNEMPNLQKISDENIPGVNIICIDIGENGGESTLNTFIKDNGYTMNIAYDVRSIVGTYYPTQYIPYTVLVKDGVVVWADTGSRSYNAFKSLIEEYK